MHTNRVEDLFKTASGLWLYLLLRSGLESRTLACLIKATWQLVLLFRV